MERYLNIFAVSKTSKIMKRPLIVTAIAASALLAACSPKADNAKMLSAHDWALDEIVYEGNDFTETPPEGVTVIFADSIGRVSGNGGCNRFSGAFKLSGENKIEIGEIISTEMACPDSGFEGRYFKLLNEADQYKVDETSLELKASSEKATLIYKPVLKPVE